MSKFKRSEDYTDDYKFEHNEHVKRDRERRERAKQKDKRRLEYVKEWDENKWLNE